MCVSILLNLLWLLPVTLLDTISAGDSTKSPLCQALPSHSYSIPVLPAPDRNYTGVGRFSSSPAINCSDSGRLVAVKVQMHSNRHTARAGIFVCPDVKILHLQVIGVTGHFLHAPVKATLTSCTHANDTAVLRKGRHRSHFTVRFAFSHPLSSRESLNYSYSVYEDSVSKKHHGNVAPDWPVAEDDHHSIQPGFRWKRAVQNRESTMSPSLNSTAGKQDLLTIGSTAECGLSKTCIRYGFKGCGHLTCDYMLSYHVINTTDVDMEISARGTGWVAVGFSSDKFMGGDDDVIGCKRDRKLSSKVVAMSLGNLVKHTPPKEKKHRLVLKDGRLQDGHIYCRVMRPLKFKERIADSDLDLFNDWHQLYAFGDIDGTGRILQHTELPRVSENKIAMIRVTNIMVVTSVASFPLSASGCLSLLLPLVLAFDGS